MMKVRTGYFFMCYLHPSKDSLYFNPDSFRVLENDITKFSCLGHILLAGDFNARTGRALDHMEVDNNNHITGDIFHHNFSNRNKDNEINNMVKYY